MKIFISGFFEFFKFIFCIYLFFALPYVFWKIMSLLGIIAISFHFYITYLKYIQTGVADPTIYGKLSEIIVKRNKN
jgi:hypothetical protein